MPSTRITLASNANQSIRTIVLLSDPGTVQNILDLSRNKLRIKKPKRLFVGGSGRELLGDEDVRVLVDDCTILVSAGEDYIGNESMTSPPNTTATIAIISESSFIDAEAIKQLKQTATLPGIERAVGMPDLHPGGRYPIGCSFVTKDAVYPALIGGDIGCGMSFYRLDTISSNNLNPNRLSDRIRGLDVPWDGDTTAWLAEAGVEPTAFDDSLGTIGGGNHFAEIQFVERVEDVQETERLGLLEDKAYLLVHSGSRGLGQSILTAHTTTYGHTGLPTSTPEFPTYLNAHNNALTWARRNRELIAHRLLSTLTTSPSATKLIDIWHNNVELKTFSDGQEKWIHRKGAAPSDRGPIVVPGSRGAYTYILLPFGNQEPTAYSLAHGAGRRLPRTKARQRKSTSLETTSLGSRVICEDRDLLMEEAPEAYKGIEDVVSDLEGVARVVAVMRPVVTYKMRKE